MSIFHDAAKDLGISSLEILINLAVDFSFCIDAHLRRCGLYHYFYFARYEEKSLDVDSPLEETLRCLDDIQKIAKNITIDSVNLSHLQFLQATYASSVERYIVMSVILYRTLGNHFLQGYSIQASGVHIELGDGMVIVVDNFLSEFFHKEEPEAFVDNVDESDPEESEEGSDGEMEIEFEPEDEVLEDIGSSDISTEEEEVFDEGEDAGSKEEEDMGPLDSEKLQ
jgi:hypothetical protein